MNDYVHDWRTLFCAHCGHSFKIPVPCKDRFCDVCSKIRLSKINRKLNSLVKKQESSEPNSVRFLTLTIISDNDLSFMVRKLQHSFRKLRQRQVWKKYVTGGASVIEITRSENGWHAHIHALIAGSYIPFTVLRDEWQSITGATGCYIKKIPSGSATGYLTKYITKADSKLSDDDRRQINNSLFGNRLYQPFGQWHGWNRDLKLERPPCPECNSTVGYLMAFDIMQADYIMATIKDKRGSPPAIQESFHGQLVPTYIDPF